MEKLEITEQWFNNICEDKLNRFLLSMNDGQGDNCVCPFPLSCGIITIKR